MSMRCAVHWQMGERKFVLGRRAKGKDGQHARPNTSSIPADTAGTSHGSAAAATRKPRKPHVTKAKVAAIVAAVPIYCKFSASQRQSAAAARAARFAERRGMPAASSSEGKGTITPPCCSRVTSAVDVSPGQMSTHSPVADGT